MISSSNCSASHCNTGLNIQINIFVDPYEKDNSYISSFLNQKKIKRSNTKLADVISTTCCVGLDNTLIVHNDETTKIIKSFLAYEEYGGWDLDKPIDWKITISRWLKVIDQYTGTIFEDNEGIVSKSIEIKNTSTRSLQLDFNDKHTDSNYLYSLLNLQSGACNPQPAICGQCSKL